MTTERLEIGWTLGPEENHHLQLIGLSGAPQEEGGIPPKPVHQDVCVCVFVCPCPPVIQAHGDSKSSINDWKRRVKW